MDEVSRTTVTRQDSLGNAAQQTVTVKRHGFLNDLLVSKFNQVVFTIVSIINLLILVRFTLLLLGANRTGFVNDILTLTNVFVAPFMGIFPSVAVEGSYFEMASVVAMIIWLVLAVVVSLLVNIFSSDTEA